MNVKYIQLYKGEYIKQSSNTSNNKLIKLKPKVIVFDLDETIGSFYDLELLWRGLHIYKNKNDYVFDNTQENFNKLLDLYPEFLRYGILNILDFLKFKKQTDEYTYIQIINYQKYGQI